MKKFACLFVICMMIFLSNSVVFAMDNDSNTSNVNNKSNVNNTSNMTMDELNQNSSLQLMFAKLQLEQAELAKTQALDKMDHIARIQEEQKLVSQFLNDARQLKANANTNANTTEMPQDMVQYMNEHSLTYDKTGDDLLMSSEEWDVAIASLEARLEELGTDTQMQMVYLQDFMGQYNSYLQGANTQISNSNQTLTSLARGQSMYGDSDAGMLATTLIIGIVLGCVITLAVQNMKKRNVKL